MSRKEKKTIKRLYSYLFFLQLLI